MEDRYVLVPSELDKISTATAAFNVAIRNVADLNGLAFVDAAAMLEQTATGGINFDAGTLTADYVTGGAFSLDGIHLTPSRYALVANRIIEAVNETYNSTVPKVNIGNYGTVTLSNDVQ